MTSRPRFPTLLKLRDIAQAHERGEGAIVTLAERFHASTRTVMAAIRKPSAAWQAAIESANATPVTRWEYAAATLSPVHGDPGDTIIAYAIRVSGQPTQACPAGDGIVPAANMLGKDGWEIVHVATEGEKVRLLLKRQLR